MIPLRRVLARTDLLFFSLFFIFSLPFLLCRCLEEMVCVMVDDDDDQAEQSRAEEELAKSKKDEGKMKWYIRIIGSSRCF